MDFTKFAYLKEPIYLAVLIAFVCLEQSIVFLAYIVGSCKCEIDCPKEKLLKKIIDFIPVMGGASLILFGVCKYCEIHTKAIIKGDVLDYLWVMVILAGVSLYLFIRGNIHYKYNRLDMEKVVSKYLIVVSIVLFAFCRMMRESMVNEFLILYYTFITIECILIFLLNSMKYVIKEEDSRKNGSADLPEIAYENLLKSRQYIADSILDEIRDNDGSEPFAILLDGPWGSGKTSVVRSMEKRAKERALKDGRYSVKFLFINVGYGLNPKTVFPDICNQLNRIFEEEAFYNKNNSSVETFFGKMMEVSSVLIDEKIGSIYNLFKGPKKSKAEARESLNDLLDAFRCETNNKIVIVVDDIERCPETNITGVFALLHEAFALKNCVTLMVSDYDKLVSTKGIDKEQLDKYFQVRYKLSDAKYDEVYSCIISKIDSKASGELKCIRDFEHELYEAFENYSDYASTNLDDNIKKLINPRAVKRLWREGVLEAKNILEKTNYKSKLYLNIRKDVVCAAYGVLKIIFPEIYYGIKEYGLNAYMVLQENLDEDDETHFQLILEILTKRMNEGEVNALDWLISFDQYLDLEGYNNYNKKVQAEWNKESKRNPENIDDYIEYIPLSMGKLIELLDWMSNNKQLITLQRMDDLRKIFSRLLNFSAQPSDGVTKMLGLLDDKIESFKDTGINKSINIESETIASWKNERNEFIDETGLACIENAVNSINYLLIQYNKEPMPYVKSFADKDTFLDFIENAYINLEVSGSFKAGIYKAVDKPLTYLDFSSIISALIDGIYEKYIKDSKVIEEHYLYQKCAEAATILANLESEEYNKVENAKDEPIIAYMLRTGDNNIDIGINDIIEFGNIADKFNDEEYINNYDKILSSIEIIISKLQKNLKLLASENDIQLFIEASKIIYNKCKSAINKKEISNEGIKQYYDIPIRLKIFGNDIDKLFDNSGILKINSDQEETDNSKTS